MYSEIREVTSLEEIKGFPQWVCWVKDALGKKLPINPHTRKAASTKDATTWGSYEQATKTAEDYGLDGIGFVFTEDDPFTGIDLDDVINVDGEIAEWAAELIGKFASYTELSPSHTGVHIIVRGRLSGKGTKSGSTEVYDRGRYFTWTGSRLNDADIADRQGELDRLYDSLQSAPKPHQRQRINVADAYTPEDHEVLEKARKANVTGQRFASLYDRGDVPHIGHGGRPDNSRAHWELIKMLAFWTGNDAQQMDRLFTLSAHGQHEKWDRADYRSRTIQKAIDKTPKPYQWTKSKPQAAPEVKGKLDGINSEAQHSVWTGRKGARNRWVLDGLVYTGCVNGADHPEGVAVRVSVRYLAWLSGIGSTDSVQDALKALEQDGWISVLKRGRKIDESNVYLVRARRSGTGCVPVNTTVPGLRTLRENGTDRPGGETKVVQLDHSAGRHVSYTVSYEPMPAIVKNSVGKMGALLIEKVMVSGGRINVEALAALVGSKRVRDFKRRHLAKVINAGLLSVDAEGVVSTPEDLQERLTQHLADTGCNEAADKQMRSIKAARIKADTAPTSAELRSKRKPFSINLEHMKVRDTEQDQYRELEKVGPTATTFLRDELSGVVGMYWPNIVDRFTKRGGSKKVLDRAAAQLDVRWIKEFDGWYVALREEIAV